MSRLEMPLVQKPRSYARWALSQAIPRAFLSVASRPGDPLAELMWSHDESDYIEQLANTARAPVHSEVYYSY